MCGDPILGMSTEFYFTTGPSAAKPYPMRLGIIADLGETANSTQTVEHLLYDKPQFVTLIGDLTCALSRLAEQTLLLHLPPPIQLSTSRSQRTDLAACCADADDITANGEPCQPCKLHACWLAASASVWNAWSMHGHCIAWLPACSFLLRVQASLKLQQVLA